MLFFFKIFGRHKSFLWGQWYPCFGLLVMTALGFKARVDPWLACFVACMQWISQIHLWCNTCWPLDGQHGSQSHSLHACNRGRMPQFDWDTSRAVSRRAIHSATAFHSVIMFLHDTNSLATGQTQRDNIYGWATAYSHWVRALPLVMPKPGRNTLISIVPFTPSDWRCN